MDDNTGRIRTDFDRIALLDADAWNHNNHYHTYLLKQIPDNCGNALDIGCGAGSFSRLLARQADSVLSLDLSPQMIKRARQISAEYPNIDYQVADVITRDIPENSFDCIVSIATLHHLPFAPILGKMKSGLKANGILMVLDLYEPEGIVDLLINLLAVPVHLFLKWKNTGRLRDPADIQAAWVEHGKRDSYLTVSQVSAVCDDLLPGAIVKKHLLWRYSIVWQKSIGGKE